jgi:hypothetical protein
MEAPPAAVAELLAAAAALAAASPGRLPKPAPAGDSGGVVLAAPDADV